MFYLTWKGLRGRRRETGLLLIVLSLAFLLSSTLAIVLPSTREALQLAREESYGKWQLMVYDESEELCAAMETAAAERGAQSARLVTVGETEDGDTVSAITPELLNLGKLELLSGRLPESDDEIVLVDTQFSAGQAVGVGDEVKLIYSYEVTCAASEQVQREGEEELRRRVAESREALQSLLGADDYYNSFGFSHYVQSADEETDGYMRNSLLWAVNDADLYDAMMACYDEGIPLAEGLSEEQYRQLFEAYCDNVIKLFATQDSRTNARVLVPFDGGTLSVMETKSKQTLIGTGFSDEYYNTSVATGRTYSYMNFAKTYTVTGILKGYEATWDSGGNTLPDAFVSAAGQQLVAEAAEAASAYLDDLVLPTQSDTLLLCSDGDAATFYTEMAAVYESVAQPRYEVETYTDRTYLGTQVLVTGMYYDTTADGGEIAWQQSLSCQTRSGRVFAYRTETSLGNSMPQLSDRETDAEGVWYSIAELSEPGCALPGLEPLPVSLPTAEELYLKNEYTFRINTYSYPEESGTADAALSTVLNGILVLMTACAVLVICMVQSKHRARGIILLRSIGMQNAQAAIMQLYEAGCFLVLSLLIGLPLGFVTAYAVLHLTGKGGVTAVDLGFLLQSALFGAASLIVGLQLPVLLSLRMPLTGKRETAAPKKLRAAANRPLRGGLPAMERAAKRFNRRRDRTARLLCVLGLVLALLTLLLSHLALDTYRTEVTRTDMPDYTLTATYGMSTRYLREKTELYESVDELGEQPSRVESYIAAEGVTLNNFTASPAVRAASADSFRVAGLAENSEMLARLLALCGPIDTAKLLRGEGCILLAPNYLTAEDGSVQFSADPADRLRYQTDDTVKAGDVLSLTAYTHAVGESGVRGTESTVEVEVLAVLHEYSDIWLFGESAHPLTAVSGQKLVTALYPNASRRYDADQARWAYCLSRLHCENCSGKTYINFYASDDADHTASYWNLAQSEGMEMKNYYKEKQELLSAGTQQRALTVLLGAAAVLLVLVISAFILSDLAEQGRRRVGILRALGVSGRAMLGTQLRLSMGEALTAVLWANGAIAVLLAACAVIESGGHTLSPAVLFSVLQNGLLWQYPWRLHALLTLGFWALTTVLRTLPYRRLCRASVIATIKGMEVD